VLPIPVSVAATLAPVIGAFHAPLGVNFAAMTLKGQPA